MSDDEIVEALNKIAWHLSMRNVVGAQRRIRELKERIQSV